jgi:4-hydroxybenzoate polyprenyltransferase
LWSILQGMAKMQRWRRSRSAGEGAVPAEVQEEQQEYDAVDSDALDEPEGGEVPDPADPADEADEPADPAGPADEATEEPAPDEPAPDEPNAPEAGSPEADEPPVVRRDHFEMPHVQERAPGLRGLFSGGRNPDDVLAIQLLQAAHAKQAVTTALAMGFVAAVAGRPAREAGVVLLTVLVGQTILGWHNDIVDRQRDAAHNLTGKPLAMGRIEAGTVWYAIVVATLLLVPLAITTGIRAGCLYLASVAVGMLGNVLLRTGFFSWWSWAVSFALLPAYLSYGGWGGQAVGSAPEPAIVVLAALLGIGVHFMRAVWGLVADHEDGWTYLPLKLGLKLGATRLLALSSLYTAAIVIALAVVGAQVGLSR